MTTCRARGLRCGPIYPHGGHAFVVGVTGAPGVGKSTLVDALVAAARARGERVAVVAVDPSSPFSGGALLGDRVRMQRHATDEGVFIRSLATRGQQGGLSRSTTATRRGAGRRRVSPWCSSRPWGWGRPRSTSPTRPTPSSS